MLPVPGLQKTAEADVGHTEEGAVEGTYMVSICIRAAADSCACELNRKNEK